MAKDLRIVPVTPAHFEDLDELFARGDPRTCQCAYLRLTHHDYARASPADRRSAHHQWVESPVVATDFSYWNATCTWNSSSSAVYRCCKPDSTIRHGLPFEGVVAMLDEELVDFALGGWPRIVER